MAMTSTKPITSAPTHRAYVILHLGYTILPLIAGADKFFNFFVEWDRYLAPQITNIVPARYFMMGVGVVEIAAAFFVLFRPRIGGYVVAAWLWGIILNLLMIPAFYDIALRDFGLSLGALALANLAQSEHEKGRSFSLRD
jgi:hypothetical protein